MALSTNMKSWLRGVFGVYDSSTTDVEAEVEQLFKHSIVAGPIPDDGGATTNVDTTYFWTAETDCKILGASFVCNDAETADATNYATINLLKANGGGGSTSVVATVSTNATNVAAGVPYDLTVSTAAVTAGEVLAFQILKVGAGGLDLGAKNHMVVTVTEA
jgi:hypothetical protein